MQVISTFPEMYRLDLLGLRWSSAARDYARISPARYRSLPSNNLSVLTIQGALISHNIKTSFMTMLAELTCLDTLHMSAIVIHDNRQAHPQSTLQCTQALKSLTLDLRPIRYILMPFDGGWYPASAVLAIPMFDHVDDLTIHGTQFDDLLGIRSLVLGSAANLVTLSIAFGSPLIRDYYYILFAIVWYTSRSLLATGDHRRPLWRTRIPIGDCRRLQVFKTDVPYFCSKVSIARVFRTDWVIEHARTIPPSLKQLQFRLHIDGLRYNGFDEDDLWSGIEDVPWGIIFKVISEKQGLQRLSIGLRWNDGPRTTTWSSPLEHLISDYSHELPGA